MTRPTGPVPMWGNVGLALGRTGTPFGPGFWGGAPIPSGAPAHPNAALFVKAVQDEIAAHGVYLETHSSPTLYVVPADQPLVPVGAYNPRNPVAPLPPFYDPIVAMLQGGIPIPPGAVVGLNPDLPITVYQGGAVDALWELWRARINPTTGLWEIGWGGKIQPASASNGIFPLPLGETATGLAVTGQIARVEELQVGHIGHPIELAVFHGLAMAPVDASKKAMAPAGMPPGTPPYSWPANRHDGTSTDPMSIPEGLRFYLDSSLDLTKLKLHPVAHTLAQAGKRWGFIVDDTCPAGVNIRLGSNLPYVNAGQVDPYIGVFGPDTYHGGYSTEIMTGMRGKLRVWDRFPWEYLRALPQDYGKPA